MTAASRRIRLVVGLPAAAIVVGVFVSFWPGHDDQSLSTAIVLIAVGVVAAAPLAFLRGCSDRLGASVATATVVVLADSALLWPPALSSSSTAGLVVLAVPFINATIVGLGLASATAAGRLGSAKG